MIRYLIIFLIAFNGCGFAQNKVDNMQNLKKSSQHKKFERATFAGGCFWCTEAIFQRIKGVKKVESGYSGGSLKNPTYQEVSSGLTGYAEVIEIKFDPTVVPFSKLVEVFFATHNPTTLNRQGYDTGTQYRSAIFYHNNEQKEVADVFINALTKSNVYKNKIVTEVSPFKTFYKAENYHQNYYNNNKSQQYCKLVINPKLEKFLKKYKELVKH